MVNNLSTSAWRIEMLGHLCLRREDRVVTSFRTRKIGSLIAYLAYHRQHRQRREELVERFFPEAADSTFRVALNRLRLELTSPDLQPEAILCSDRTHIWLSSEMCTTDVADFERLLKAASAAGSDTEAESLLKQAIDLYRGPLLPADFSDWVSAERVRLEDLYLTALGRLTQIAISQQDYDAAIDLAYRALRTDPVRESSHEDLIRVYVALGRPAAAQRQYAELTRILSDAMQRPPAASTQAIMERITGQKPEAPSRAPLGAPPAKKPRNYLPRSHNRFFGREDDLEALTNHFWETGDSLISLTGPAGSGKTRLALEVAFRLQDLYPSRLFWVPLADLTDADQILGAIADAIQAGTGAPANGTTDIVQALNSAPTLLLLDNFEHLHREGVAILAGLRDRVVGLSCLVTSRQRLGLSGEKEYLVLPLPSPLRSGTPAVLQEFPALQLFVDRAQAARADFKLTPRNAATIADICQRLEGIPLALELAAAWVEVLSPIQILAHLNRRFDLLVSERLDLSRRHRTLRAAVEWSYFLLPEDQQRFFAALSVFRGGFTEAAVSAVCDESRAVHLLRSLRERSLILLEQGEEEVRYRLLETLREFAAEQLSPGEKTQLAECHLDYFTHLAEEAYAHRLAADFPKWLDCLDRESENIRAALEFYPSVPRRDDDRRVRLTASLWLYWHVRGHASEGLRYLEAALEGGSSDPTLERSRALHGAGVLASSRQEYDKAYRFHQEALAVSQSLGDDTGMAGALGSLGILACNQDKPELARRHFAEALERFRKLGANRNVLATLNNLGVLALQLNELQEAEKAFDEGLAVRDSILDGRVIACTLSGKGAVSRLRGDYAAARLSLQESLSLQKAAGNTPGVVDVLLEFAALLLAEGDTERSTLLFGAVSGLSERAGFSLGRYAAELYEVSTATLRDRSGQDAFRRAWAAGHDLSTEQAIAAIGSEFSAMP